MTTVGHRGLSDVTAFTKLPCDGATFASCCVCPRVTMSNDDSGAGYEVVAAVGAGLGEGPVWDARSRRLVWVDITGMAIHHTDPETGHTDSTSLPLQVGAVVPRARGGYVAALQDGFWVIGDGPPRRLSTVLGADSALRFNDGKCDPAGRFWAGTMALDAAAGAGSLYCLDTDGEVTQVLTDVSISNGLAWSSDRSTMFFIDSPTQRIDAFDYTLSTGAIGNRRVAVEIPASMGEPDGMTIDAEGGLWVALWGGSAVHRYLDGRLERVISLPVSQPTSCAFGGPHLDELYVTSAWQGLNSSQREAQPLAGALFRIRPGVQGILPFVYGEAVVHRSLRSWIMRSGRRVPSSIHD